MDFRPLNNTERKQLLSALHANAKQNRAILMDRVRSRPTENCRRKEGSSR
jgi:hypothetical protein